jgi:putative membrane protein
VAQGVAAARGLAIQHGVTEVPAARVAARGEAAVPARQVPALGTLVFSAHVVLIVFATAAMVTILAGGFPALTQGPYSARVFELGWRYTGQVYVVLGVIAALLHAVPRFGWRRAAAIFAVAVAVALSSELLGTNAGLPFGPYHYTEMLGYRVAGDVPYVIPLSWSYMLYCCLAMCSRVLGARDDNATRWRWALVAGAFLVAWDVALEVQMTNVSPAHWVWDLAAMPAWIPAWLGEGVFYGMPLLNWVGWFLTATLIARLMVAIVPPTRWHATLATASLPVALYAVNGLMPIATTARHGLGGAAAAGLLAMGLVIARALVHSRASLVPSRVRR